MAFFVEKELSGTARYWWTSVEPSHAAKALTHIIILIHLLVFILHKSTDISSQELSHKILTHKLLPYESNGAISSIFFRSSSPLHRTHSSNPQTVAIAACIPANRTSVHTRSVRWSNEFHSILPENQNQNHVLAPLEIRNPRSSSWSHTLGEGPSLSNAGQDWRVFLFSYSQSPL